jgi:hypothetical protein
VWSEIGVREQFFLLKVIIALCIHFILYTRPEVVDASRFLTRRCRTTAETDSRDGALRLVPASSGTIRWPVRWLESDTAPVFDLTAFVCFDEAASGGKGTQKNNTI